MFLCIFIRKGINMNDVIHDVIPITGSTTLNTGVSGSTDSILVNGVEIMNGSVPFNTSLEQTATDVATNITTFNSIPSYTAIANGTTIIITGPVGSNGFVVTSSATTITTTDINMSGGHLDMANHIYTQVYAGASATPIINGSAVSMVAGVTLSILVKTISGTPDIFVLGQKRIVVPTQING